MRQSRSVIPVFVRLFDLIYPRRCPICDGLTGGFDRLICRACENKVHLIEEPICMKCGKRLGREEREYCADCSRKDHVYIKGRAALEYDSAMKRSMARFKYGNRREYADFYAEKLYQSCGDLLETWQVDALIPIPLHKSRQRKRGYNQARLLAERLGKISGIPVVNRHLVRSKKTRPQKELSDLERKQNLKNAFQLTGNDVRLKKVVLIDDIYTTGSTIDAAAACLLEQGVEKVYFLAVCIGRGY